MRKRRRSDFHTRGVWGRGSALRSSTALAMRSRSIRSTSFAGWMPILGSPDAFVSLVSHEDAATAVVASLGVPAGIYNVVDDRPLRRREFAEAIADMLGVRPPKFLPSWVVRLTGPLGETIA